MAKTHTEEPREWKIRRARNGDEHIQNCTTGYIQPKGLIPNVLEVHHILCVHACSDETFPADITGEQKELIRASLAITDWNINDGHNNIGLPRKWAYVNDGRNAGWDGLPCHQVDHDLYLKAVATWVEHNVWKRVKSSQKKKACEDITGEDLAAKFREGSDKWRGTLKSRGASYGGTRACLEYCTTGVYLGIKPKGATQAAIEATWHIPFSMAPTEADVRKRARPPTLRTTERLQRLGLLTAID